MITIATSSGNVTRGLNGTNGIVTTSASVGRGNIAITSASSDGAIIATAKCGADGIENIIVVRYPHRVMNPSTEVGTVGTRPGGMASLCPRGTRRVSDITTGV